MTRDSFLQILKCLSPIIFKSKSTRDHHTGITAGQVATRENPVLYIDGAFGPKSGSNSLSHFHVSRWSRLEKLQIWFLGFCFLTSIWLMALSFISDLFLKCPFVKKGTYFSCPLIGLLIDLLLFDISECLKVTFCRSVNFIFTADIY